MFDERPEIAQQGFPARKPSPTTDSLFLQPLHSHGWLTVRHKWEMAEARNRQLPVDFRAALLLPVARPDAHSAAGTDIFALKAASENLPTTSFAMTGQYLPRHSFRLFEVERNRLIRLFHNSNFLCAKLLDIELFTVAENYSGTKIKAPDAGNITCFHENGKKRLSLRAKYLRVLLHGER